MKSKLLALSLVLLGALAQAQSSTSGATVPSSCTFGDIFKKTSGDALGLYYCTSDNTWRFVGRSAADNFDDTVYFRGDGTWATPTASAAWGSITGTLSNQTDLQTALNGKVSTGTVQLHVPFMANASANLTLTNQANAEQFLANSNRNIQKVDLTNYTQVRAVARIVTASASVNTPRIYAQYFTSFSTTVGDYLDIGSSAVNCSLFTGQTYCDTGWINLVAGAKADVFLTILMNGGDAAADPALGMVALQFK